MILQNPSAHYHRRSWPYWLNAEILALNLTFAPAIISVPLEDDITSLCGGIQDR